MNLPLRSPRRFLPVPLSVVLFLSFLPSGPRAQDRQSGPGDPLAEVFEKELRGSVESLMIQFRRDRKYGIEDFPMEPEAFGKFQEDVVSSYIAALGMEDWVVSDPPPGKKSPIAGKFEDRVVKRLTLENGVVIEAHIIELLPDGDQVPVVICLPPADGGGDTKDRGVPGIVCCPGHGTHALHDLVFGRGSYQRAIAVRLAEAGFASVAVEKVDSGYLTRTAPAGNDEEAITTFRLGLGKSTTRAVQLKATVAATEILAGHARVDETRMGATGVSLGGWLAIQTALISDRIRAVAEYSTKTVFSNEEMKPDEFSGVGDLCHIVPGWFDLGDRNILMFPFAPRPLLSGHGGPKDRNSHGQYQKYYLDVHRAQYEALGKPENFRYHQHDGGHVIDPDTVIEFFRKQFR
jgi:hypothetical protein